MKLKRDNVIVLFWGVFCILGFFIGLYSISINRNIELNGKLIRTPIIRITGGKTQGFDVLINEKKYHSSSFSSSFYSLGDTVEVKYLPDYDRVLAQNLNPPKSKKKSKLDILYLLLIIPLAGGISLIVVALKYRDNFYVQAELSEKTKKKLAKFCFMRKNNIMVFMAGIAFIIVPISLIDNNMHRKNIKLNGELIRTPITKIIEKNEGFDVYINGKRRRSNYFIGKYREGDTIAVRYMPDEFTVVQDEVTFQSFHIRNIGYVIWAIAGVIIIIISIRSKKDIL